MALFPFNPETRKTPILRRLVPSVLKRWTRLTAPSGVTRTTSRGLTFELHPADYVDRQILFYDDYERAQIDYFGAAITEFQPDVFVDVGANFGYYSAIAAKRWAVPRVIAFEPDPRNFRRLQTTLALNDLNTQVEARNLALSTAAGDIPFESFPDTSSGQSRVARDGAGTLKVSARTGDTELGLKGLRLVFKIDVEGHELEVLQGLGKTLRNNACLLQIESFGDRLAAVDAFLAAAGLRRVHTIASDHYYKTPL